MPDLAKKNICCGCAACFNACPKNAIDMKVDYTGFLYPIINDENCINCKKCEVVCPALNPLIRKEYEAHAYIGKHKDVKIRKESTSGGIFTAIAEFVIKHGGVVFGAVMDNNFIVYHKYVKTVDELGAFRNSKYVQSEIRNTYQQCESFLKNGRIVCYSGTPCQIQGLIKFLGAEYKNLITVDVLCRAVPSPLIFRKYIEMQKNRFSFIEKIKFRDKAWGYAYPSLAIYGNSRCLYRAGSEEDLWLRSFLVGLCDRENCKNCNYQNWPRNSDITIWDCFVADKIVRKYDDNYGVTSVMTWTKVGNEVLCSLKDFADIKEVNISVFKNKVEGKKERAEKRIIVNRRQMYIDAEKMLPKDFFKKYCPINAKVCIKIFVKKILRICGLLRIVRNFVN